MKNGTGFFSKVGKSGFVRSVVTRVLAIFIIVSIIICGVAFYSFTSELRRSILLDRRTRLAAVESTISARMGEIASIAYNIGNDPAFYLESLDNDPDSGREMSAMLSRYTVGNSFIEHLAFSRTSEPDTIYISTGERSLSEFLTTTFGMDKDTVVWVTESIRHETKTRMTVFGSGKSAYFAYVYPLPQLSEKPLAHVLMLIPVREVRPLFESLLINSNGEAVVFDADGVQLHKTGSLDDELDLSDFVNGAASETNYRSPSGEKYVLQKVVSDSNGWTYVSVMRNSDTLTGLANKQLAFIVLILLVLMAAIAVMLVSIIAQYRPISALAAELAQKERGGGADMTAVDERELLSDTIATLRDDSEQKRKYETAYYEAEAASQAKSAFLSSMSHDIRTPMNAIVGMTAIALKHKDDPDYVADCLRKVQESSDYLLDIINNVLDMSRIESGRIPIAEEPLLIPALIDSVVSLMSSSAGAKSQTLEADVSKIKQPAVLGDSIHLVQVFVNIVSNAVKFTPEGGRISIRAWQEEPDDERYGSYVFAFSDTGIGIPPEFIDHVFDTFSRGGGPAATKTEGTGLGMAIAKKLTELMGGTIACESEQGRGATFTVSIRMKLADADEALTLAGSGRAGKAHAEPVEAADLTGRRILLVEDNAMNQEIARRIIGETGAEVVTAANGSEAVEAFTEHPAGYFDIIFMDIQMPVMNGYEATEAIRSFDRADAADVPIIAMTANTFDEDVRRVKAAGMNGHIGKPYTPDTLYAALVRALGD